MVIVIEVHNDNKSGSSGTVTWGLKLKVVAHAAVWKCIPKL